MHVQYQYFIKVPFLKANGAMEHIYINRCFFCPVFGFQLQSFLQIVVFQIRVDECPTSSCAGASGCTNVLNVRDTPMVVDCGSTSLVSVTLENTAVCSCPGRDQTHQPCSAYPRNPCFNGGLCVDTQHGYRWVNDVHHTYTVNKKTLPSCFMEHCLLNDG